MEFERKMMESYCETCRKAGVRSELLQRFENPAPVPRSLCPEHTKRPHPEFIDVYSVPEDEFEF